MTVHGSVTKASGEVSIKAPRQKVWDFPTISTHSGLLMLLTASSRMRAQLPEYADRVLSLRSDYPHTAAYLRRLEQRPSFARVLREAEPYFAMFPG